MKFTIQDLRKMNACGEGMRYARGQESLYAAWENCPRSDWLLWFARRKKLITKRAAVELAVSFAKHVLEIFERKNPGDKRAAAAIRAAERWLKKPNAKNREDAESAASVVYLAVDFAGDAAAYAAFAAFEASPGSFADDAADAAADATGTGVERIKERAWQAEQVRRVIKNPFQKPKGKKK